MLERPVIGAILLILAALAGGLWWRRKRQQPDRSQAGPEPTTGATATLVEPPPFAPGAEREFAGRANRFEGLYESLHWACAEARDTEQCRGVLGEWEIRLRHSGGEALQSTWRDLGRETTGLPELGDEETAGREDVVSLGIRWLDLLRAWGMERDERVTFILEEDERERYRISGTGQAGEQVEVELPCWTYKGEVIERGIARPVAAPG